MRALRHVCAPLTNDIATALAVTLVQSRLDYVNSIPFKTFTTSIQKSTASPKHTCTDCSTKKLHKSIPVSSLLTRLHWLLVTALWLFVK